MSPLSVSKLQVSHYVFTVITPQNNDDCCEPNDLCFTPIDSNNYVIGNSYLSCFVQQTVLILLGALFWA